MSSDEITRRRLLELGLALPPLAALTSYADLLGSPALAATPAIVDDDEPTPALTEGPYFTPNSPKRSRLSPPAQPGRG